MLDKSKPGKYLYLYSMTSDTQNAPCICEYEDDMFSNKHWTPNLLSLSCCMGGSIKRNGYCNSEMRNTIANAHHAQIESNEQEIWFGAFMGSNLVYIAKLTGLITMYDYMSQGSPYRMRLDCIYDVDENANPSQKVGKLIRRPGFNLDFHYEVNAVGGQLIQRYCKDELGKWVLLSDRFAYFGYDKGVKLPESILNERLRFVSRPGKAHFQDSEEYKLVMTFLNELWPNKDKNIIGGIPI